VWPAAKQPQIAAATAGTALVWQSFEQAEYVNAVHMHYFLHLR
jgi:hypothetical protein